MPGKIIDLDNAGGDIAFVPDGWYRLQCQSAVTVLKNVENVAATYVILDEDFQGKVVMHYYPTDKAWRLRRDLEALGLWVQGQKMTDDEICRKLTGVMGIGYLKQRPDYSNMEITSIKAMEEAEAPQVAQPVTAPAPSPAPRPVATTPVRPGAKRSPF